jgi:hypothetical protein
LTIFGALSIAITVRAVFHEHLLKSRIATQSIPRRIKAKLVADMSLLPSAIEEILRWTSPVTHMARIALSDTELGGKKIKCPLCAEPFVVPNETAAKPAGSK